MKRSEMVNILDKAINSQLYQDYLFDEDTLNSVLIAIEQAGMLPPFVDQYESDTSLDLIGNRWEPENDLP
jgi:hypothetical protein